MRSVIALTLLIAFVLFLAPSSAVDVGIWDHGLPAPVPVGGGSFDPVQINYNPVGYNIAIPLYMQGISSQYPYSQYPYNQYQANLPPLPSGGNAFYFGRDFVLGMVDSNYYGSPFSLQLLADP